MPHDPARVEDTPSWLAKANADSVFTPSKQRRRSSRLTEYAWKFRYPGDAEEPTCQEADKALALVLEVVGAVLERIPPEARP